MTAQIGTDGLDLPGDPSRELPSRELLTDVTGVQPEPRRDWVNLGFHSTQRLRIRYLADDGGVEAATYPAELKPQACYLYGGGLDSALVAAARKHGWRVEPSPHIAYRRASPGRRLYMGLPDERLDDYVACWEDEDALRRVSYTRDEVESELWPWLKRMRFADDRDDAVLRRFLDEYLPRKQRAHMRPGLRFRRVWNPELGSALAETIRSDFNAVFAIAGEPALGSTGRSGR